jgi:hypothetical protein
MLQLVKVVLHSLKDVLDLPNILISPNGLLLIGFNYCWVIIGFYSKNYSFNFFLNENGFGFNNTKNNTWIQFLKKEEGFEYSYSFRN